MSWSASRAHRSYCRSCAAASHGDTAPAFTTDSWCMKWCLTAMLQFGPALSSNIQAFTVQALVISGTAGRHALTALVATGIAVLNMHGSSAQICIAALASSNPVASFGEGSAAVNVDITLQPRTSLSAGKHILMSCKSCQCMHMV